MNTVKRGVFFISRTHHTRNEESSRIQQPKKHPDKRIAFQQRETRSPPPTTASMKPAAKAATDNENSLHRILNVAKVFVKRLTGKVNDQDIILLRGREGANKKAPALSNRGLRIILI